jgi:hypothetical protein
MDSEFKPDFSIPANSSNIFPHKKYHGKKNHKLHSKSGLFHQSKNQTKPTHTNQLISPYRKKLSRKDGRNSRHVAWAQLLWRSFGVMGFVCTHCKRMMRLRAVAIYPLRSSGAIECSRSYRLPIRSCWVGWCGHRLGPSVECSRRKRFPFWHP